jgi:hypothetical protein
MRSRVSPLRVVAVAAGLSVAGTVVGAACGAIAIAIVGSLLPGPGALGLTGIGAVFGAATGAVLAPAVAFLLLRHVPLGRAILHTAIGTVIGGVLGLATIPFGFVPLGFLWSAVAGFLVAAIRLRVRASREALRGPSAAPALGRG